MTDDEMKLQRRRSSYRLGAVPTIESLAGDMLDMKDYVGKELRKGDERMILQDTRMDIFHKELQSNTATTTHTSTDVASMRDDMKEVLNILGQWRAGKGLAMTLGSFAAWILGVSAAVSVIVAAFKSKIL